MSNVVRYYYYKMDGWPATKTAILNKPFVNKWIINSKRAKSKWKWAKQFLRVIAQIKKTQKLQNDKLKRLKMERYSSGNL